MVWDSNAVEWDFNAALCYSVCCLKYAWTDCIMTLIICEQATK